MRWLGGLGRRSRCLVLFDDMIHELYCEISVIVFFTVDEDDSSELFLGAGVFSLLFLEKLVNIFNCQVLPAQLWLEAKFWQRMNIRWEKAWR